MDSGVTQTQMILINFADQWECGEPPWAGPRRALRKTGNKKPASLRVFVCSLADGGYGWTRTTDPSIMSAVL